jgi:hypothetical protein
LTVKDRLAACTKRPKQISSFPVRDKTMRLDSGVSRIERPNRKDAGGPLLLLALVHRTFAE